MAKLAYEFNYGGVIIPLWSVWYGFVGLVGLVGLEKCHQDKCCLDKCGPKTTLIIIFLKDILTYKVVDKSCCILKLFRVGSVGVNTWL